DLVDQLFESFSTPCGEHHLGALAREREGGRFSDPRARPGYHDYAPLKYAHRHAFPLPFVRRLNQAVAEAKPSIESGKGQGKGKGKGKGKVRRAWPRRYSTPEPERKAAACNGEGIARAQWRGEAFRFRAGSPFHRFGCEF